MDENTKLILMVIIVIAAVTITNYFCKKDKK